MTNFLFLYRLDRHWSPGKQIDMSQPPTLKWRLPLHVGSEGGLMAEVPQLDIHSLTLLSASALWLQFMLISPHYFSSQIAGLSHMAFCLHKVDSIFFLIMSNGHANFTWQPWKSWHTWKSSSFSFVLPAIPGNYLSCTITHAPESGFGQPLIHQWIKFWFLEVLLFMFLILKLKTIFSFTGQAGAIGHPVASPLKFCYGLFHI